MSIVSRDIDAGVVRSTTFVAMAAAVLVAVSVPLAHYYVSHIYFHWGIEVESAVMAEEIAHMVALDPEAWETDLDGLRAVLEDPRHEDVGHLDSTEQKRVLLPDGRPLVATGAVALPGPVARLSTPIEHGGTTYGLLETAHSERPMMLRSLELLLLSSLLGAGIYAALRILPLRVLRKAANRASYLASHDPLTDLPNRALFNEWLVQCLAAAGRKHCAAAVLCIDIDHFKEVNDMLGHAAGDALLRQVTARIRESLRAEDVLARLGGDEFAVIQSRIQQPTGASSLAERLVRVIGAPVELDGQEITIGASIGISMYQPGSETTAQVLLQQADLALAGAKAEGRGSFRFFEPEMNRALLERKALEADLRRAIATGQFELHYQPQVDLATREMRGVEALLRWNHPVDGWIPPDRFIPLAEETGLILAIGDWVIRTACRDAADWPGVRVAVNVSPMQFRHGDLVDTVGAALRASGIAAERLELEITEGVLLQNTDTVLAALRALKALGVCIAMDDFGTGFSSLSYLRRFRFDKIKIDRSFVADLGADEQCDSIIDAVIGLSRSLDMRSNAEGVETLAQVEALAARGCQEVQGYFFARPMPKADLDRIVAGRTADGRIVLGEQGGSGAARRRA